MGQRIYLEDYKYTGVTGTVYTPFVQDGKWCVVPEVEISFLYFVYLCSVPEDEALILKIKYGAASPVAV